MFKRVHTVGWGLLIGAILTLTCVPCMADTDATEKSPAKGPVAADAPIGADGHMQIGAGDRCPVCGMFPAKRPKTAAALMLNDGRTFYFCANGCLLRSWHNAPTYLGVPSESVTRMVVKNYMNGTSIEARKAWWVAGSDVVGPMGPALVTLATRAEVAQFKTRHGAKHVFQLSEMDDTLWRTLFPPK